MGMNNSSTKRHLSQAVVVEGKYDKIRLDALIDAVILVTNGFQIYQQPAQLALFRQYARTTGLLILTDADAAGFQIRGYLKGAISEGRVYHAYIPGIHGKEHRKRTPSAEGTLGVEGMDTETLLQALERAGVFALPDCPRPDATIAPAQLYSLGLMGTPDCAERRRKLLEALQLPPRLSTTALCEVLGTMTTAAELPAFCESMFARMTRE